MSDIKIFSADLSMTRPGFAELVYHEDTRTVELVRTSYVNNKTSGMTHGEKLRNTARAMYVYLNNKPDLCIRQQALAGGPKVKTCLILAKVVGLSDFMAKSYADKDFEQIFPTTVKRFITGDCNAKKDVVAKNLQAYVGKHDYEVDDESDAVAVAIAWLIKNGKIDQIEQTKVRRIKDDNVLPEV